MYLKSQHQKQFNYSLTFIAGILSTIGYSSPVFSQSVTTTNTSVSNPSSISPWSFDAMDIGLGGSLTIDGGSATSTGWIRLIDDQAKINVINNGTFNANYISLGYGGGTTELNIFSGSTATIDKISASDFGGTSIINVKDNGSLLTIRSLNIPREPNEGPGTLNISQGGGVIAGMNPLNINRGNINIDGLESYLIANGGINSNTSNNVSISISNAGKLTTTNGNFTQNSASNTTTISINGNDSSIEAQKLTLSGSEGLISLKINNQAKLDVIDLYIQRTNSLNKTAVVSLENSATIEANFIANNNSDNSENLLYINGGTVRAKTNSNNFFQNIQSISLGANGLTFDTQSNDVGINSIFYDATVGTPSILKKIGSGSLTLNSASTYSGGTNIEAGLLVAANNAATGTGDVIIGGTANSAKMQVNSGISLSNNITVNNLGTLYGAGEVGTTTINNGGKIQPGLAENDIGKLTINGDLTLNVGSTYHAQLATNGSYDSDLLSVNGNVFLNGNNIYYSDVGDNYEDGKFYTIIEALGGGIITQTAAPIVSGNSPFLNFTGQLGTGGTTYELGVSRNNVKFSEYALTPNQRSTANALDQSNTNGQLDNYVAGLSTDYVRNAFDLLSGEIHATLRSSLLNWSQSTSQSTLENLHSRMLVSSCPSSAKDSNNISSTAHATCSGYQAFTGWAQVVGNWNQTSSDGNAAKSKSNTGGLLLGTDYRLGSSGWHIGGMFGYGKSTVKNNARHSSADLQNYTLGVHAGKRFDRGSSNYVNVMGGLSYTHHSIKTDRLIPRISQTLTSKYSGNTVQAFGEVGYAMAPIVQWKLEPFVGLNVSKQKVGSFEETGGYAGVHSKAESKTYTTAMFGVHAQSNLDVSGKPMQVRGTLGLKQALGNKEVTRTMAFNQGSPDYLIWGVPRSSSTLVLGLQAQMSLSPNATLEAGFNGEFGKKVREQAIQARVRWAF